MKFYRISQNGAGCIDIPNKLEEINKALGWDDAWNTPTINLGGRDFVVICSDTGKLRHEPISALSSSNLLTETKTIKEPFIVGTIILSKFDGIDDFEGLNDKDIEIIEGRLLTLSKPIKDFFQTILVLD